MDKNTYLDSYGDVLLPSDIQQILHLGRNNIYNLLNTGRIKSIKIGNRYLIPKIYLIAFLKGEDDKEDCNYGS